MNNLEYSNHFAKNDFILYFIRKEDLRDNIAFLLLLEKITDYGVKHYTTTCDDLVYFLTDTVPGLDYVEACAFCEDDILTETGLHAKREFWNRGGVLPDPDKEIENYCNIVNGACDICKFNNVFCNLQKA